MLCPACREPMVIVEVEGVELDACPSKHGLWFDKQEIGQLYHLAGAPEGLEHLEEQLHAQADQRRRRRCPRCRAPMELVVGPDDESVVLDRCRRGHGLWFDRGEVEALLTASLGEDDAPLRRIRSFLGGFSAPAREEGTR